MRLVGRSNKPQVSRVYRLLPANKQEGAFFMGHNQGRKNSNPDQGYLRFPSQPASQSLASLGDTLPAQPSISSATGLPHETTANSPRFAGGVGGPSSHVGGGGPRNDGLWRHDGVVVPWGSVAVSHLTDEDLERLDAGRVRRGLGNRPQPRRSASDEERLQALCEWLHDHGLNTIGVVTFSDEYAARHSIYSLNRALDDVWAGMVQARFPWKFVLAGEFHRTGRTVPHVHVALEIPPHAQPRVCSELWRYFFATRGRSRFEPMRDVNAATLYGLKDTVKDAAADTSTTRFRLWHPKRCKRPSGYGLRGGGGDPPRS